jgi:tetratricopeptide (TPR) repeat protein
LPEVLGILKAAVDCRQDKEVPLALSNMGILLLKTGNPKQALEALSEAVKMDPGNPLSLLRLGVAYKETGQRGKATIYIERLLRLNPEFIPAHLCLAELYLQSGLKERGKIALSHLLHTTDPEELTRYLNQLGAQRPFIEITPDMASVLHFLAEALLEKGVAYQKAYDRCIEMKEKAKEGARPEKTEEGKGNTPPFPPRKRQPSAQ